MAGFEGGSRFPFINLQKALARAKQLYDADQRGNEMPIPGAFGVWGYSEKSSGGFQTIGALKMYGLLEDSGAKETRKVKLTKQALDYFRDEREEVRAQKLQDFATNPRLFNVLFNKHWGPTVPDDAIARSVLKVSGELNEQSARSALGIYKENMSFAKPKASGSLKELADVDAVEDDPPPPNVAVGDYVQWTVQGADQFKPPRKVTKIDGRHAWVHGSSTGLPMDQLTVTAPPAPIPASAVKSGNEAGANQAPDMSVLLVDKRLQITADVDAEGLKKLQEVLTKYGEILSLLH